MYLLRLLSLSLFTGAILFVIHSILLVPSYVFLQERVISQEIEKEFLGRTLAASGSEEVEERLRILNKNLSLLETLPMQPLFVAATEEVLEVSRIGIKITQITYSPKDANVQISVRGIATDRDSLRSFAKRLEEREKIIGVDFPIGNLSREKDLPFTISIILES